MYYHYPLEDFFYDYKYPNKGYFSVESILSLNLLYIYSINKKNRIFSFTGRKNSYKQIYIF